MKHWARLLTIITTLFWAANSSHALQPTEDILDRQCRSSESFVDNLHKQTKQSKKLHTKMVEIYDHYLKLLESCKDNARLHKSALQLAQTLTNRDIEYDIEQQLLGGNDFNNIMLFFEGLYITSPINAAVMMTTNPILVLIMSAIILKESLRWSRILGITLGIAGALFLITRGGQVVDIFDADKSLGNLLVFLNGLMVQFFRFFPFLDICQIS